MSGHETLNSHLQCSAVRFSVGIFFLRPGLSVDNADVSLGERYFDPIFINEGLDRVGMV
jgi:hypothetical protein